jgi:FkbM family methyltransferase
VSATVSELAPVEAQDFFEVTEADIDFCYRLLLHREPDPAGKAMWRDLIQSKGIRLDQLTSAFLQSDEFRRLRTAQTGLECVELPGFCIYVERDDFEVGKHIASAKCWEPHVTSRLRRLLRPGYVFIDVGANVGYFTLLAASLVGAQGKVIAFEPNPANCDLLNLSIEENGFDNVRLYPHAVADREQTVHVYSSPSHSLSIVMGEHSSHDAPQGYIYHSVRAVQLDSFLIDIDRIDVVKIDTDGNEPQVLAGMSTLVRRHRPVLFLEFYPEGYDRVSGTSADQFLTDLESFDYELFILSNEGAAGPCSKEEILNAISPEQPFLDLAAYPRRQTDG